MRDIQNLAGFFKEKAAQAYSCHEGGYIANRAMKYDGGNRLVDLKRDFMRNAYINDIKQSHLELVQEKLSSLHLRRFNFVADGSTSVCYESSRRIVRFGPAPVKLPPKFLERSYIRDACPLILQSDHRIELSEVNIFIEVMPFVATLCDSEIPDAFKNILPGILDQTCFEVNIEFKDLAVLPDGTPVYVDPGAINLKDWERQPTQADFDKIRENTERMGLPEPLSWVLPDGRFRQELFFPAPKYGRMDLTI